jgi:cation-transporting ATPase 13A3/4/5
MSVIIKNFADNSFRSFVKGSPERIKDLCDPSSLPSNFEEMLEIYTQNGYRVLGLATKKLVKLNYIKA